MTNAQSGSTDDAAAPEFEEALDAGLETARSVMTSQIGVVRKGYETAVSIGRDSVEKALNGEAGGRDKAAAARKADYEAAVESGDFFIRGIENVHACALDFAAARLAEGVAAHKALFAATSPGEAVEIQQDHMRRGLDGMVRDGAALARAWTGMAADVAGPVRRRIDETIAELGVKAA